ncbi:MAG: aminotransferase class IV [Planctomycetota bacterium]
MNWLIRINGVTYRRPEDATVSIFDHGFLFGDSVYEVCRTHGGRPYEVGPHLARLGASARRISLDLGHSLIELAQEIESAAADRGFEDEAYIRIIVTRGVGALSIDPVSCGRPTRILILKPLAPWAPELYTDGIALTLVATLRNAPGTVDPSIKTGNYLNSVIALIEAKKAGAQEALMQGRDGHLTECTTSNLFFVREGIVHTPSLESGILSGITRSQVIRIARENGVSIREGSYNPGDLRAADEAFITSTTRGIMPVRSLDGQPIGGVGQRPVTARLSAIMADEVNRFKEEGSAAAPTGGSA